jgi:PDZ domain-containing secreted protein
MTCSFTRHSKRRMARIVIAITLALILVLLASACGTDNSDDEGVMQVTEMPTPATVMATTAAPATATAAESLTIQADDTPEIVVNKAIALRDLGRIDEALAAYDTYAAMFADTDPGAEQYARIAKQFTQQMDTLAVRGGAYMVGVADDSAAGRAGLMDGDIIIEANGAPVRDDVELWNILQARTIGNPVEIVYLRLDEDNVFHSHRIIVEGTEKLGVWYILI